MSKETTPIQEELRKDEGPLSQITTDEAISVARIILSKDDDWMPLEILDWPDRMRLIVKREPDTLRPDILVVMVLDVMCSGDIRWTWDYTNERGVATDQQHCPNSYKAYKFLESLGYLAARTSKEQPAPVKVDGESEGEDATRKRAIAFANYLASSRPWADALEISRLPASKRTVEAFYENFLAETNAINLLTPPQTK